MTDNGDAATLATFSLSAFDPQPVRWLWPERFPLGKVSLLQGDPSAGKSYLSLDIAARVSTARHWPDGTGAAPEGKVLLVNGEDDPADTLRPRLDALGGNPERVEIVAGVTPPKGAEDVAFVLDEHLSLLQDRLASGGVRLLVIDPVSAFLGQVDSHINAQVRALLAPLAGMASAYGTAIVCVNHLNKAVGGKPVYRGMGSLACTAAARAVWQLTRDKQERDRRLLLPVKCNLAPSPTGLAFRIVDGIIQWEPGSITDDLDELLSDQVTYDEPRALGEAKRFLAEVLGGEPVAARAVYAESGEAGIARRTLERAKAALGVIVERQAGDNGTATWTWRLPKIVKIATHKKVGDLGDLGDLVGDKPPNIANIAKIAKIAKAMVSDAPDGADLGSSEPGGEPEAELPPGIRWAVRDEHAAAVRAWQAEHADPPQVNAPKAPDAPEVDAPVVPDGWTAERWPAYLRCRGKYPF